MFRDLNYDFKLYILSFFLKYQYVTISFLKIIYI